MGSDYLTYERERRNHGAELFIKCKEDLEKAERRVAWLKGALFYYTNKIYTDEDIDESLSEGRGI